MKERKKILKEMAGMLQSIRLQMEKIKFSETTDTTSHCWNNGIAACAKIIEKQQQEVQDALILLSLND